MRKLFVLMSVILIVTVALSACQAAAPTTPTVPTPTILSTPALPTATLQPSATATALQAATKVVTQVAPASSYIGSGKLDGKGIPPDFFSDVHIRKAFSYAFDWDTYITDIYNGEAAQSIELPMPDMLGYDPKAPHYSFDLKKAADEFQLVDLDHDGISAGSETDGSDVWNLGFHMQIPYNTGNTAHQTIAEILANNLAKINSKFVVETVSLSWPTFLDAQRAHKIPIIVAGWLEDIHDPNSWFQPYTTGSMSVSQSMPEDLRAQFKTLLEQGVNENDLAKRAAIYQKATQLYYDQVPGIPINLATQHTFEQRWVNGRVANPLFPGMYFYPIHKTSAAKDPNTFVYAAIGDSDTFDPALAYDTASGEVIQNIYETLVFYKGDSAGEFVPQLASAIPSTQNGGISADGKTVTFQIRQGVKFSNGESLTPSDVAYSLQRGMLQGGTASPQWLFYEAFFGAGTDDISLLVDPKGSLYDNHDNLAKADPAVLQSACEKVKAAVVADDDAGTVTLHLAQPWAPLMATLAQTWGSIMDQKWVVTHNGWNGSCDAWQNYYAMQSANDPFSTIAMGTGPYTLDHRTPGQEIVLKANPQYWRTSPAYEGGPSGIPIVQTATIKIVPEWSTRFDMLKAGDADIVDVPVEDHAQVDALVGERCQWDNVHQVYASCQTVDSTKPLRLYVGRLNTTMQDVAIYNFNIR
jgi:ABC-type dipeptide transport system, periplasmic component